jgi:hypothetical protein
MRDTQRVACRGLVELGERLKGASNNNDDENNYVYSLLGGPTEHFPFNDVCSRPHGLRVLFSYHNFCSDMCFYVSSDLLVFLILWFHIITFVQDP